jgi:hypothetical protein
VTVKFPELSPLPPGEFKTVMADPPWLNEANPPHAAASEHFEMLHPKTIAGRGPQVAEATASHAQLYLWAAGPFVGQAFDEMESWGVRIQDRARLGKDQQRTAATAAWVREAGIN